jgi:hypothetical protein
MEASTALLAILILLGVATPIAVSSNDEVANLLGREYQCTSGGGCCEGLCCGGTNLCNGCCEGLECTVSSYSMTL